VNVNDATRLTREKLALHGLTDKGWTVQFDRARRRFGQCRHNERVIRLSTPLVSLNEREKVLNVILHEIAHALVGPQHGHDRTWRSMAAAIGAKPERCYTEADVVTTQAIYVGTCPSCGQQHHRHAIRGWLATRACKACCDKFNRGRYDARFVFTWTRNGLPYAPPVRPIRTRRSKERQIGSWAGPAISQLFGLDANEEEL
jgi:predicted SprT family Zn-dependent metalloprotease